MERDRTLIEKARLAAMEPYTDAPTSDDEWLRAVALGADAAVGVVLEHLIDTAKTSGDAAAVEAMYAIEVDLGYVDYPTPVIDSSDAR